MKSFAHHYSSDISREQFELIRTDLEGVRKRTKPRKVDLYDIFCALLYTLKNGCVWRDLPSDFPKWETVYYYWLLWTKTPSPAGITPLDKVFKKIVSQHRLAQKRSVYTSFVILDAQSVKNTDPAESSGYDGGKKVSGIKRHLAVDINGLPMAVHVTTANVSERDGANALLALNKSQFDLVQRVMAMINAEVIIAKQSDLRHGQVTPQRWVIERSFSWLGKHRRLWRNCERKLNTSKMMISLAFLRILLKRF
ncbi:IS5 family transposase [Lactiplantibacillus plantarum]|uniref:IS5 family transposase n=1 Tax=Lactiplantibacillus argentoratensis TaxID=271881 RepID=UPI00124B36CD|nr:MULTISPECIES: IS5 family transposase [Lactiplantibacillus]KAB1952526.1 IS5 family transposase [Lactiplantibacillus plantarum]UZM84230.1 IS5 family transposase [Lactiplantibacillus argentoratensis]